MPEETATEIRQHIQFELSDIGSNLQELETKVRRAFDWRVYFARKPAMLLGLAFGGGLLASALIPIRIRGRRHRRAGR